MGYVSPEEERMDAMREAIKTKVHEATKELLELITMNAEHDVYKDHIVDKWHEAAGDLLKIKRKL